VNEPVESVLRAWRDAIDHELTEAARREPALPSRLADAVHYGLTGGGKRLRGLLLMASYEAADGGGDSSALAAAVEIVHAYSLVHDDLPCMDNDNMRRGRPTTHRAFDVATATVAGVAMVPIAVRQALRGAGHLELDADVSRQIVATLMRASGATGMVGGQLMDLEGEGRALDVPDLETVHGAKTGALIAASMRIGAMAGSASKAQLEAMDVAGQTLGLAFQIADDVLDATASSEILGKTAGHDAALAKSTYASALGVATAGRRRDELIEGAMRHLDRGGMRTPPLEHLANFVAARRS